jgi:hypothetical protein
MQSSTSKSVSVCLCFVWRKKRVSGKICKVVDNARKQLRKNDDIAFQPFFQPQQPHSWQDLAKQLGKISGSFRGKTSLPTSNMLVHGWPLVDWEVEAHIRNFVAYLHIHMWWPIKIISLRVLLLRECCTASVSPLKRATKYVITNHVDSWFVRIETDKSIEFYGSERRLHTSPPYLSIVATISSTSTTTVTDTWKSDN